MLQIRQNEPSGWAIAGLVIYIFVRLILGARSEERRRSLSHQPHTWADSALLLLSGLLIVGVFVCAAFFEPLRELLKSRLAIYTTMGALVVFLTYIFNRKNRKAS